MRMREAYAGGYAARTPGWPHASSLTQEHADRGTTRDHARAGSHRAGEGPPRHPRPPRSSTSSSSWPPGWPSGASAAPRSVASGRRSRTTTPRSCPRTAESTDGVPAVGAVQPEHVAAVLRGRRARGRARPARTERRCSASSRGCRTCGSPSAARRSGRTSSQPPAAAIPSEDGKALLIPVELDADKADEVLGGSSVLFEGAAALRASAKDTLAPSGLNGLRHRPRRHPRRLRHGVRRHRRHPARRRARRGLPDPADRLPQPDPALRRPAHRGVRRWPPRRS